MMDQLLRSGLTRTRALMWNSFDARIGYCTYGQTIKQKIEGMREKVLNDPEVIALAKASYAADISAANASKTAATTIMALKQAGQLNGFLTKYAQMKSLSRSTALEFIAEKDLQLLLKFKNSLQTHGSDLNQAMIEAQMASLEASNAAAKIASILREKLATEFQLNIVKPKISTRNNNIDSNIVRINVEMSTIFRKIIIEEAQVDLKKAKFQSTLTELHEKFEENELKKDPKDRELNPRGLPNVKKLCEDVAALLIQEPLVIVVDGSYFGPGGNTQAKTACAAVFFTNKGTPLGFAVKVNLNDYQHNAEMDAMVLGIENIKHFSTAIGPYRIISDYKTGVDLVQIEKSKILASLPTEGTDALIYDQKDDALTKVAKNSAFYKSAVEFRSGVVVKISDYLSHVSGKQEAQGIHIF